MKTFLALVAAAAVLTGCSTNQHGVTTNELPAPVLATLEANSKGGKVNSIVKVSETKRTEYRADVTNNGAHWDVVIDETGKLVYKKAK